MNLSRPVWRFRVIDKVRSTLLFRYLELFIARTCSNDSSTKSIADLCNHVSFLPIYFRGDISSR